ncbi:SIP domain-containing protein [Corynebacterium alimapuense]|uniref:SIP domain-containing protein n=1 Tax=Corynebacterium alimapuense TaxID=1576874 RepID=UPI001FEC501F|nr:SIP domain-containing protein [Corynebacterium alimapuense]
MIEASLIGKGRGSSSFSVPNPAPSQFLIFGDTASLPAINTLLDVIGGTPAQVWLEWQYESDRTLSVHATAATKVRWLQRLDDGRLLREQAEQLTPLPGSFAWISCDSWTTRSIVRTLRTAHALPRESIKSQAYWK